MLAELIPWNRFLSSLNVYTQYDNPIPTRLRALVDCSKIPAPFFYVSSCTYFVSPKNLIKKFSSRGFFLQLSKCYNALYVKIVQVNWMSQPIVLFKFFEISVPNVQCARFLNKKTVPLTELSVTLSFTQFA
jgi:hypothetical protein